MGVFEELENRLKKKNLDFEVKRHKAVFTSEEAAKVRGVELRTGVKAMVCKAGDEFLTVLIRADKRVDFKKISALEGTRVTLANAEEVLRRTGCEVGSVPPFGFKPMKTYLDREILGEERVNFNAGFHTTSVEMSGKDMIKVLKKPILF